MIQKMRLLFSSLLLIPCTTVLCVQFINPPAFQSTTDFSLNTIYVEGSIVNIEWTAGPPGNNTSLTLFQLNGTQFLEPFEYLTQNVSPSITSLAWTVQTTKNLSVSNMFFFTIFLTGSRSGEANSHYFNITSKDAGEVNLSSSITSSIQSSSLAAAAPTMGPSAATASIPASTLGLATGVAAPDSSALSTGAKAGIGVGVSAAVLLGIGAALLFFARWKKQDVPVQIEQAREGGTDQQEKHQLSGDESAVVPPVFEMQGSRP